jgi:hypothetical protein
MSTTPRGAGSETRVVRDRHRALSGDLDPLVRISHPDVEVGGPRGTGNGAELLREWARRSGICLDPGRVFGGGDVMVVEQGARWRSRETAELGAGQSVASAFRVREGRVASVVRHGGLAGALDAAGLDESREIEAG